MRDFLKCTSTGKLSMMRLGFAVSMVVGSVVALCGAVAMFVGASHADTAMTVGTALIGAGGFSKAVQAKYESRAD